MRSLPIVLLAVILLAPQAAPAQTGSAGITDSVAASAPAPKKKGGLFGKVKGLAKNKVVKTVAKVALCTAVPGGQVIAGALDAADTKDVGAAASTVAGGGGSCMPGMLGAGAPGAAAGLGAGGIIGAVAGGVPNTALPGQPTSAMPAMGMSPEQMKQMQEQYAKMGMDTAQLRAMQEMMAGMEGPGLVEPAANVAPSGPASGAPALSREKGRIVVRQLPWLAGSETLRPGGDPMFGMAMREVTTAIQGTGKRYKIEARVEEQGGKAQNRSLARKRAAAVLGALAARGVPADRLAITEGKSDKDPRIIVSEGK